MRTRGFSVRDAEDVETVRQMLARSIAGHIREQKLTQLDAATAMGVHPSQVSLVVSEKLYGFSIERLMTMLAGLGSSIRVEIVV